MNRPSDSISACLQYMRVQDQAHIPLQDLMQATRCKLGMVLSSSLLAPLACIASYSLQEQPTLEMYIWLIFGLLRGVQGTKVGMTSFKRGLDCSAILLTRVIEQLTLTLEVCCPELLIICPAHRDRTYACDRRDQAAIFLMFDCIARDEAVEMEIGNGGFITSSPFSIK